MRRLILQSVAAAATLVLCLGYGPVHAQMTRTWISGVGDDANPCSRTAPCKTFAGVISKTATGGEIDALDPGGFGAVTITKSITIDGGGGQVASTLVSGTNGIAVNAPAGSIVTLRNLRFQGLGTGLNGISFTGGGELHVYNCEISGFTQSGISATGGSKLFVADTRVFDSVNGVSVSVSSSFAASMIRVRAEHNSGAGFVLSSSALFAPMIISQSVAIGNGTGVSATGTNAVVGLDQSVIVSNATGVSTAGGGRVFSYKDNDINGNGTDGTPLTALRLN
jgi:hypothetical protein